MAKQIINVGVTANDKSGDPLRSAFVKVNDNFNELYSLIGGTTVSVGATAPSSPSEGQLWWDSVGGKLYIRYGTSWVDATTPTTLPGYLAITDLKTLVAASTDFADFKTRIAAL